MVLQLKFITLGSRMKLLSCFLLNSVMIRLFYMGKHAFTSQVVKIILLYRVFIKLKYKTMLFKSMFSNIISPLHLSICFFELYKISQ